MKILKTVVVATALCVGSMATAGNPDPAPEDVLVLPPQMPEPGSSASGLIIPLLLLALIGVAS